MELLDDELLLSNAPHKNVKHHALLHVKTGNENKYGIVAFHVHLTGKAKSNDKPDAIAIIPTITTIAATTDAIKSFIFLSFQLK